MKKYLILGILSLFILSFLFIYQSSRFQDGRLHMVACNVGQGDAIFIRTEGGLDVLIDGGPDDKVLNCLANHMPFWDKTLEVVILTHPDADHLRGLVSVVERYKINYFVTVDIPKTTAVYKFFQSKLKEKDISAKYLFAGDKINFGKSSMTLFWPQKQFFLENSKYAGKGSLGSNDFAIVGKLNYGKFSALLTADAGANILDKFAWNIGKTGALKVPHHGSKTGMSDLFLTSIKPEIAIISVGERNNYGHPAALSLELLKKYNINILRTDLNGEVEVVSDGVKFWLH